MKSEIKLIIVLIISIIIALFPLYGKIFSPYIWGVKTSGDSGDHGYKRGGESNIVKPIHEEHSGTSVSSINTNISDDYRLKKRYWFSVSR